MAILSDETIREYLAANELVPGGDPSHVEFCSYQFTPEKIVVPGPTGTVIDWSAQPVDASFVIRPGQVVWIRTRSAVRIPRDITAFYWQTNTLARKGLMLVNTSMVEPGYEGPLACLFANFGKQDILVTPRTRVAKIIFFKLDRAAANPSTLRFDDATYDDTLREVAVTAPESFLQVANITANLSIERDKALDEIREEARKARKEEAENFRKDAMGAVRRAFAWSIVGLAILTAAINLAQIWQSKVRPNLSADIQSEVQLQVRRAVASERASVLPLRDSSDAALRESMRRLQRTVDSLRPR